ncbi:MAG: hypothetical protein MPN21_19010 [Thermoanaerobaculia bacterium]|nr:hypothetical protein [Thermoanaerobaculia bacterium]
MLVSAPDQREALRALAQEGIAEVDLAITIEGRHEIWISLADAMERSDQLFDARFRPLALRFDVPTVPTNAEADRKGSGREGGRTCEDTCEVVYERCLQRTCTPGVPRTCQVCDCPTCNAERQACLDDCNGVPPPPPGCTQPTVTEYVERDLAGFFPSLGLWCFITNPFNTSTGHTFEEIILVYENQRIRRTEACDGTVTLQIVDTFITYGACNLPTFFVCPFPTYYPFDICP